MNKADEYHRTRLHPWNGKPEVLCIPLLEFLNEQNPYTGASLANVWDNPYLEKLAKQVSQVAHAATTNAMRTNHV